MTHKLGILAIALLWCLEASASVNPGAITGTVRDTAGVPQMGAVVEVLANSAARTQTVLTDTRGAFTIAGLLPGLYTVKVTAPSFLPTIRERIHLQSGANLLLNLTLNTLFEAIQLVPRHKASADSDDDWRWALRSMANRPILRLADDKPLVVVQRGEQDGSEGQLKARVSFISSSDGDAFNSSSCILISSSTGRFPTLLFALMNRITIYRVMLRRSDSWLYLLYRLKFSTIFAKQMRRPNAPLHIGKCSY